MTAAVRAVGKTEAMQPGWTFPLSLERYDQRGELTDAERRALRELGPKALRRNRARGIPRRTATHWTALARLVEPLDTARAGLHHGDDTRFRRAGAHAAAIILQNCVDTSRSYWAWTTEDWAQLCGSSAEAFVAARELPTETTVRPFLLALAYLLGGFDDFQLLGTFNRLHLARFVFGAGIVEESMRQASAVLDQWGYRGAASGKHRLRGVFSQALLINRSPRLEDLDTAAFERLRAHPATGDHHGEMLYALQRAVAALGHCDPPVRTGHHHAPGIEGTATAWAGWVERWHDTSTLTPRVRAAVRTIMAKAGRWLVAEHPEITEPGQWTRQTCAAWVAVVDRMNVGDYVQRRDHLHARAGTPISPRTKAHNLMATRTFFRDCQEWEWIGRRFDPARALAVPRSVSALIGTNPRVIADEVWAKLLWAGLNLDQDDLPGNSADTYYPMELIRAITLTWLFSGLRSDELSRLRVGCVRWQHNGQPIAADSPDVLAEDAVCLLDVPVHKTGTAFTKPVDPLLGQAIEAWQALRPRSADHARPQDQRTRGHALRRPRAPGREELHQPHHHPRALRQGRCPEQRRARQHHQSPGPFHDRVPALQRQGADDAVRAAGVARPSHTRPPPSTTRRSARTPCPRPTPKPATSPATCAPSRCSSTATPSPPAPPPPASHGSTTTSATAGAATAFSSSVRTGWPAPVAISTPRKTPPKPSCSRPAATCSACSPASRSPTTNAPPSTTDTPQSPPCSTGSPTSPPPPGPPRVNSAHQRP